MNSFQNERGGEREREKKISFGILDAGYAYGTLIPISLSLFSPSEECISVRQIIARDDMKHTGKASPSEIASTTSNRYKYGKQTWDRATFSSFWC